MGALHEIGDRLWVVRYEYADQTIGVIGGADGLLVIDTRSSHRQADELASDIRPLGLPVRWVVNTHMHWDHTFGNAPFDRAGAELWGHERCARALIVNGEQLKASLVADDPAFAEEIGEIVITPPRRLLTDAATIEVGGRRVELRHVGRGHTDNDVVLHAPDAGAVFAGDLLENGAPPYFADGYPLDWPATVEAFLPWCEGVVVPGHGEVADRAFATGQLEELRAIADLGRAVASDALSLEDAVARGPYGPTASLAPLERAVAQARGQLEAQPA